MNIILFDTAARRKLFPLTLTRAVADLRVGILTVKERWEKVTGAEVFVSTDAYLQPLYQSIPSGECFLVDATVVITTSILTHLKTLSAQQGVFDEKGLVIGRAVLDASRSLSDIINDLFENKIKVEECRRLERPFQIFQWNDEFLRYDFPLAAKGKICNNNCLETSNILNASKIFIEEGADVSFSTLNASTGPIYIGKNTTIMEGSTVRGPFALCEGATLKMSSKIYGATTIGPYSVAGGEIKNAVLMGYSNKAHDGYLGDSVVGEWCNFGAGTSNSNVKNSASEVKIWDYAGNNFITAGQKCGLIMGDYSRTAINTSLNTGTVVGVCCNIFGAGLTPKVIADFTWGTDEIKKYEFEKALNDIRNWKNFKNKQLSSSEVEVLRYIFEHNND